MTDPCGEEYTNSTQTWAKAAQLIHRNWLVRASFTCSGLKGLFRPRHCHRLAAGKGTDGTLNSKLSVPTGETRSMVGENPISANQDSQNSFDKKLEKLTEWSIDYAVFRIR